MPLLPDRLSRRLPAWAQVEAWSSFELPALRSLPFLIGAFAGFALCCLLGRFAASTNMMPEHTRFHDYASPASFFYPTVSQMESVARDRAQGKILVVIGGDSVFYGTGQDPKQNWTDELQRLLGDRFRVVNLALRGGMESGITGMAFESLARQGQKVIYVANRNAMNAGPPMGVSPYQYLFWDAYYKGKLFPFEPRAKYVDDGRLRWFYDSTEREAVEDELKTGAWLDAGLYFKDLWGSIAFRYLNTVWSRFIRTNIALPRRAWAEVYEEKPLLPVEERFRRKGKEKRWMRLVRGIATQWGPNARKNIPQGDDDTELAAVEEELTPKRKKKKEKKTKDRLQKVATEFEESVQRIYPPEVRAQMLVVNMIPNPYFSAQFTAEEKTDAAEVVRRSKEIWTRNGYNVVTGGLTLTAENFNDRNHLTTEGGRKLAAELAPEIRKVAERVGYLKN